MAGREQKLPSAISEARNIVDAAQKRAADLRAEAEKAYEEAREKGYENGYEEGRHDAVASAVRLLEDTGAIGDKLASEAARLALAIAGTVVGEQLKIKPETVTKIAIRALQESIIGDAATIVVNPADKSAIEQVHGKLRKAAGGVGVAIKTDEDMSRGGCLVKTEFGEVDASVETLLLTIATKLGVKLGKNGR